MELLLFRIAVAVIGLHVVDDNYVQSEPGTSAGDHLVSGLVPLGVLALAAWGYPRLRAGWRGAMALAFGVLLAGLYGGLYGLLQLEDVALLSGSLLLFAVLSLAMWFTRNLHRAQSA